MEQDFNKIIIVSFREELSRAVGEALSHSLGMLFCDSKDLLEYELADKQEIEKLCSKEYLLRMEKRVFKRLASFVNVVVSIGFDNFVHNFDTLKKGSITVFLNIPKSNVKDAINSIAFEQRVEKLKSMCTLTLNIRKTETNFVCERIINALGGIV